MRFRDRIKALRRVPARDLRPNAKNWRLHPRRQHDALRGVLAEVGFADAVLARELDDGSLELIDGHLRAETAGDAEIPVLVLDVDEAEAAKILATLDPLAGLAEIDSAKLDALLREIDTGSAPLQQLLADLAVAGGIVPRDTDASQGSADAEADDGGRFCVVVECDGEAQQVELLARFEQEGLACRALIA